MAGHKYIKLYVFINKYEIARAEAHAVCFQQAECWSFLSDLFGVVLSLSIELICFALQNLCSFYPSFFCFCFCFF